MPVRVRARQSPRSHLCGHEGRHVLQRNRRLSSRSAVLLVLRRLAKSNTDSPAAAETRHLLQGTDFPRHGVGGNIERNKRGQEKHAQASVYKRLGAPARGCCCWAGVGGGKSRNWGQVERRRCEGGGAVGAEEAGFGGGVPLPNGRLVWGGAVPLPRIFFHFLFLE